MTVLVLSEDLDPTVDRVVDQLNERGVPVVRCDTSWFPHWLAADAELVDSRWVGHLHTPDRSVALQDLRSIWYRRPTAFMVLWSLPVLWVNHPARQADLYKPTQLAVAAGRCGLAVPHTLVTNRPERARQFADAHPGGTVVKPLSSITEDGQRRAVFTHLLTDQDRADLSGVEHTMHLFQAFVDKDYEVRLTVVGRQMFAAAIHAGTAATKIDFRVDYSSLRFEVVDVPDAVAAGVAAFLDHFQLAFGVFDFAVDAEEWWLLECNGGGQYGFVEQATGLPISAAVADLLAKGHM